MKNKVCFKCLNKFDSLNIIKINSLDYGSYFDLLDSELHLCDECKSKTNSEWWKFEIVKDHDWNVYKYEEEIIEYIDQLPTQGIELYDSMKIDKWEDLKPTSIDMGIVDKIAKEIFKELED